jgi:hypothetical protein
MILVSAGFMLAHLFTNAVCFELAGFYTLAAAILVLVPTTVSGWITWKRRYKGALTRNFRYKIVTAFSMIFNGLVLLSLQGVIARGPHTGWHFVQLFLF